MLRILEKHTRRLGDRAGPASHEGFCRPAQLLNRRFWTEPTHGSGRRERLLGPGLAGLFEDDLDLLLRGDGTQALARSASKAAGSSAAWWLRAASSKDGQPSGRCGRARCSRPRACGRCRLRCGSWSAPSDARYERNGLASHVEEEPSTHGDPPRCIDCILPDRLHVDERDARNGSVRTYSFHHDNRR